MKTEQAVPGEVRRERMVTLISERQFMRVSDLSEVFAISEVTVRSDLAQLEQAALVRRVHGGATEISSKHEMEPSYEESEQSSWEEKRSIGEHAASLVASGNSVIIDVGTTATAVARALAKRTDLEGVVVFTNGITTALELEPAIPRLTVILTGGQLRPKQHSLVDPMGNTILSQVNVNLAFIGCNGVHPDEGVTNINLPEAGMKTRMVEAAQRVVVVAEGAKLGRISVTRIAHLADIDLLITGSGAPPELVAQIADADVEISLV